IMMNISEAEAHHGEGTEPPMLQTEDRWILSRLQTTIREATENMERYELGIAVQKVYDFIWDEFCDWYIEMVKPRLRPAGAEDASRIAALWTLTSVLIGALKLLHPYMPFITEEIYQTLVDGKYTKDTPESIMIAPWPVAKEALVNPEAEREVTLLQEAVRGIRAVRNEMNVAPPKKTSVYVVSAKEEIRDVFNRGRAYFTVLSHASELLLQEDKAGIAEDAVSVVLADAVVYIPLAELVDMAAEKARLEKEKERLEKELARSKGMLANERFLSKAPPEKIAEEKEKQQKYEQTYAQVLERLNALA
ncbi:MAG: class I tRNA ligase family protein, partial [Lachnospiraceae bacterium]|nr:class I tRNA ligase family protein [Lachnospiraceae bacterium]